MPEGNEQQKITNGEYERAFTELAGFLYELYRKQKRIDQSQEITNDNKENYYVSN
jgi:hypothetical protein